MAEMPPIAQQEKVSTEKAEKEPSVSEQHAEDQTVYLNGKTLALVMVALYSATFLVALDRTIIATAVPRITDDFHSLVDTGWYGSSYLLAQCTSQLLFGRIYTFYNPKWVFLMSIGLFEVGSAICGATPSSTIFIVGRALAGLGNSGIFSGTILIMVYIVPLSKRPIYQGLIGAIFGVASVMGPLLGGVFTDHVTWRWCFYINLPIGALTTLIIVFILKLPSPKTPGTSIKQRFLQLDPLGSLCFLPSIVCLLLALQWGGSKYAWKDGRVIALLVIFGILIIAFIAIQFWKKETATVPPRVLKQRSIASGFWFSLCLGASMIVLIYYLPVWFQAIKGLSAIESGIRSLPLILSLVVASIVSGGAVAAIGYYAPFMILSTILMSIGAGLLTTFQPSIASSKWIGYQVLIGIGLGLGMQQSNIAAQTVLSRQDVPIGVSLMFLAQSLGGAVFVSIAQSIFTNSLISGLIVSGLDPINVTNIGATEIRKKVATKDLSAVLLTYNHALTSAYNVPLAMACFSIVGALVVEWRNVKGKKQGSGAGEALEQTA